MVEVSDSFKQYVTGVTRDILNVLVLNSDIETRIEGTVANKNVAIPSRSGAPATIPSPSISIQQIATEDVSSHRHVVVIPTVQEQKSVERTSIPNSEHDKKELVYASVAVRFS